MQYTLDLLNEKLESLKSEQFGWVVALPKKEGDDIATVQKIITDIAVQITSIEHDIKLIEASRGLNARVVKQIVDEHYREHYKLDENDNFIGD
ncbi:hypothetical protein KVP40.0235 [Vibrio phage KVP40]|uniref:Uncharacterized protein n=2 Tax=Schizotequatrovirus KVP40 TaxID=1914019 RepID=Q6WHR9_BPKVM|nr:hypothetical protein KVP40.0235 [Vibrio phage KVP40]QIW91179.1 hypothetical protein COHAPHLL_00343 [Vibrio phage V09]UNA01750.1 hypothetical protein [Vibrio phage PC-Liy1]URQ03046.1 hypothetical protein PVA8_60 [Vibrio phage PVA8]WBM58782.1 hypothetical protein vBValMPVA8_60 [Vibrio phage vB_ValM_PVA8]AAQ64304.1 hypothetical protein KVP40.0235 [Vibrio phage KVP40]